MTDELPTLDPTPNPDANTPDSAGSGDNSTPFIPPAGSPARMPKQIGKYRIKKLIGQGGMGAVYQAVQEKPRRNVAIKLMKSGVTSSSALRRFEYESQLLARLRHPGIAEVYDAGTHEAHDGAVPYFVMEYIPGAKRITDYVRDKKLSTKDRLNLFLEVASAVHHGHTKGIIHRDLKPDNIIVDSHGRVKVIDFGVARATDSDMAVTTMQTDIGQLIGTVQYMSPEQVEAEPDDLDTRSDVYSLGVVLYEILCGKLPYDVSKMKIYDATRVVRDQEAMRLSTVDSTLRGDVETIVAKALEKDRDRRYQSAQELAADIGRYLKDEAIMARPPSLTYQVRVFTRRNKAVVTGVAAVFVALLLGLAGMSYLYVDTRNARNAMDDALQVAEQERATAIEAQTKAVAATQLADDRAETISRNQYYLDMIMAGQAASDDNGINRIKILTDKWLPESATTTEDLRGWEWHYLRSLLHEDLRTFPSVTVAKWTNDGIRLAFRDNDRSFTVTEADTGVKRGTLPPGSIPENSKSKLSPDAEYLAVALPDGDFSIQLWQISSGRVVETLSGHGVPVNVLSWSPGGTRLASAARGKGTKIWDTKTGQVVAYGKSETLVNGIETHHTGNNALVGSLAWAPDNRHLALTYSGDDHMWIIDTVIGTNFPGNRGASFDDAIGVIAWSPDSPLMAISQGYDITLWNSETFEPVKTLSGHSIWITALAWGPDGKLASASFNRNIKLWDTQVGQEITTFKGHTHFVNRLGWNPDGTRLLSSSLDGTAKIWDATATKQATTSPTQDISGSWLTCSPDNEFLTWVNDDRSITVWDVQAQRETSRLPGHQETITILTWNFDGDRLASTNRDGVIKIWDPQTAEVLAEHTLPDSRIRSLAWHPNGDHLALGLDDNTIRLLNLKTGDQSHQLAGHNYPITLMAWSPNGDRLATKAKREEIVRIWNPKTSELLSELPANKGTTSTLAWSHDSELLAWNERDVIQVWNVETSTLLHTLQGHANTVFDITFNPDGSRIVSASSDNSVKIWDLKYGQETTTLNEHQAAVQTATFSTDGKQLVTVDTDGVIKIWDATKGYQEEQQRFANEDANPQTSEQVKSSTP